MHPIQVLTTEAAFDLMDEVRQLRAQADRWYRLGRFMVDERTLKALADLAEDAEAKAMLREGELKGTAAGQSYVHGMPTSYAIEPDPHRRPPGSNHRTGGRTRQHRHRLFDPGQGSGLD
jgi:hypothetical protein